MGIEDRDWYREAYAEKNGGRYDAAKSRYHWFDRITGPRTQPGQVQPPSKSWHPLLSVLLTFWLCAAVYGLVKLISKLA